jgi:acetyl-CoA carboxylase carboxyl transferase subunit alpha
VELGIADTIVQEPPGGAHRDHDAAAEAAGDAIARALSPLVSQSVAERLEQRYDKFRRMGSFAEAQRSS